MTQGYILKIPDFSVSIFEDNINGRFGEPVPSFKHSRGYPLVVFISAEEDTITHLALGRAGLNAGTDLRRLNLEEIHPLKTPLSFEQLLKAVPANVRRHINDKLEMGGILPPQSFQQVVTAIREIDPHIDPMLTRFDARRYESIARLSQKTQSSLAEQKEAVNTALQLAGIDRKPLLEWSPQPSAQTTSFLDGLSSTYLREDVMIQNDITNFPGLELIKTYLTGRAQFEDRNTRLDILLANRTRLEELTGTDLIYYNATYKSFVMVQYKAMEHEVGKDAEFRLPNNQLTEEIARMDATLEGIGVPSVDNRHEYRISFNPFFIKLCPRIALKPDTIELTPGMYFTLEHWRCLEKDPELVGVQGGRKITYNNAGRHINNTDFANLVRDAWVGTAPNQSAILEPLITDIVQSGKAVMFAIKSSIKDLDATAENHLNIENELFFDEGGEQDVPF